MLIVDYKKMIISYHV